MFCTECGAKRNEGNSFCTGCGKKYDLVTHDNADPSSYKELNEEINNVNYETAINQLQRRQDLRKTAFIRLSKRTNLILLCAGLFLFIVLSTIVLYMFFNGSSRNHEERHEVSMPVTSAQDIDTLPPAVAEDPNADLDAAPTPDNSLITDTHEQNQPDTYESTQAEEEYYYDDELIGDDYATAMLYRSLQLEGNRTAIEITWDDGRITGLVRDINDVWFMYGRDGYNREVAPSFTLTDSALEIRFPTTERVYYLYDDYTGIFGDEGLHWSW